MVGGSSLFVSVLTHINSPTKEVHQSEYDRGGALGFQLLKIHWIGLALGPFTAYVHKRIKQLCSIRKLLHCCLDTGCWSTLEITSCRNKRFAQPNSTKRECLKFHRVVMTESEHRLFVKRVFSTAEGLENSPKKDKTWNELEKGWPSTWNLLKVSVQHAGRLGRFTREMLSTVPHANETLAGFVDPVRRMFLNCSKCRVIWVHHGKNVGWHFVISK